MMTIPNVLTYARIMMIPLFVISFYLPFLRAYLFAAVIFCIAAITDWLDGYLARRLKQETQFGAFLDPVADKLLVTTALLLLVGDYGSAWLAIPAAIIVGREIAISALREWMAEIGKRTKVSVGYIGKLKTAVQMISIVLLLSQPADFGRSIVLAGFVLLYIAVVLTLWSMFLYLRAAIKDMGIDTAV